VHAALELRAGTQGKDLEHRLNSFSSTMGSRESTAITPIVLPAASSSG
jgi:hypothetical protein